LIGDDKHKGDPQGFESMVKRGVQSRI